MSEKPYRPFWFRLTPFLGRPPELTRHQWSVLGLVAIVSLFEQYDVYLFSLNLRHIQADLAIAEADLGWLGSLVRSGALISVLIALAADRFGRRRMLLLTVVVGSLVYALAPEFKHNIARGETSGEVFRLYPAHNREAAVGTGTHMSECGFNRRGLVYRVGGFRHDFADGSGHRVESFSNDAD